MIVRIQDSTFSLAIVASARGVVEAAALGDYGSDGLVRTESPANIAG